MEHSKNYYKVLNYYVAKMWSETMVINAIGKWITQEEADIILNGGK